MDEQAGLSPNESTPEVPSEQWMGTSDAAKRAGVTERRIRYMIDRGHLAARKTRRGKRDVWEVRAEDLPAVTEWAIERRAEQSGAIGPEDTRNAILGAYSAFAAHFDACLDREAAERRSNIAGVLAEVGRRCDHALQTAEERNAATAEELAELQRTVEDVNRVLPAVEAERGVEAQRAAAAIDELRRTLQHQAEQIAALTEELQQERRRSWWARLFVGGHRET